MWGVLLIKEKDRLRWMQSSPSTLKSFAYLIKSFDVWTSTLCYSQKFQTNLFAVSWTCEALRYLFAYIHFSISVLFYASSELPNFRDLEIIVFPLIFNSVKPFLYHGPKKKVRLLHTLGEKKNVERVPYPTPHFGIITLTCVVTMAYIGFLWISCLVCLVPISPV